MQKKLCWSPPGDSPDACSCFGRCIPADGCGSAAGFISAKVSDGGTGSLDDFFFAVALCVGTAVTEAALTEEVPGAGSRCFVEVVRPATEAAGT